MARATAFADSASATSIPRRVTKTKERTMRKLLLGSAAAIGLLALTPAAFADSYLNGQLNIAVINDGSVTIKHLDEIGGSLDVSTTAVGNNYSLSSPSWETNRVGSVQINAFVLNDASVEVKDVSVDYGATVSTQAVGNNLTLKGSSVDTTVVGGEIDKGFLVQANVLVLNDASISAFHNDFDGPVSLTSLAVGNNISVASTDIDHMATLQANVGVANLAGVKVIGGSVGGDLKISTTAVGNNVNIVVK
jgi:hypothetical protein